MFRYVILLLFINTYDGGFGIPVPQNTTNGNLAKSLLELAIQCDSTDLSSEINKQVINCNVSMTPPYQEKQFQCLLFYDINSQLCSASAGKILSKSDELIFKMNQNLTINQVCNLSRTWDAQDLPDYPLYKSSIHKIFENEVTCGKVCTVDSIFSEEVNFYCKYYIWGLGILKSQRASSLASGKTEKAMVAGIPIATVESKSEAVFSTEVRHESDASPKEDIEESPPEATDGENSQKINKQVLPEISAVGHSEISNPESSSSSQVLKPVPGAENKGKQEENTPVSLDKMIKSDVHDDIPLNNNANKIDPVEEEPPKKDPESGDKVVNALADSKQAVIDSPNLKPINNPDTDDYQGGDIDSDEGKEGMPDLQNPDDGDDPTFGELDTKPYQQSKTLAKKNEVSMSSFNVDSSREFSPNMQDSFSETDDDNFFPFFLTSIVLVVLLYVLYHNKSKVSKLVLGLIVEGRQTGRRRNSRGHSYRRLDTLEHAMSSNAAATTAPSKIIY